MDAAKQKSLVLKAIAAGHTLSEVCEASDGPPRHEVLRWREVDKEFSAGYERALLQAGSAFADKALQRSQELAELAATGRLTSEGARALQAEIDTLRWMAAHHDSRFDRLRAPPDGVMVAEDGELLHTRVVITLPHNNRDDALSGYTAEELAEHRKRWAAEVERRDGQLRHWVRTGRMTEEAALLARSQWILSDDAAWVPMPKVEAPRLPYFPKGNGEVESTAAMEPREVVMLVKMYGRAKATYTLKSGREYTADWAGQIVARSHDIVELRAQGLRMG